MAVKMVAVITDDYDGSELKPGQGQTISFTVDGTSYEIDLSDKNAKKFASELEPWISKAHKPVGSSGRARGRSRTLKTTAAAAPNGQNADIRAWANQNGHPVSARGRISATVRQAYDSAH